MSPANLLSNSSNSKKSVRLLSQFHGFAIFSPAKSPAKISASTYLVVVWQSPATCKLLKVQVIDRLTDYPAYEDQAAFSPDGKQIVFVSTRAGGHANLWTLDIATRKAKPLTSGDGGDFRPAWSPDGKWIAFSSDRGSDLPPAKGRWERLQLADVYLIRPDGSGLRRISEHGGFCGSPKWTPDSRNVVAYCMSAQETWDYRFTIALLPRTATTTCSASTSPQGNRRSYPPC